MAYFKAVSGDVRIFSKVLGKGIIFTSNKITEVKDIGDITYFRSHAQLVECDSKGSQLRLRHKTVQPTSYKKFRSKPK